MGVNVKYLSIVKSDTGDLLHHVFIMTEREESLFKTAIIGLSNNTDLGKDSVLGRMIGVIDSKTEIKSYPETKEIEDTMKEVSNILDLEKQNG